jgi:hypothetical protein
VATTDEIPVAFVVGGLLMFVAAIVVGWTLGQRNRR